MFSLIQFTRQIVPSDLAPEVRPQVRQDKV